MSEQQETAESFAQFVKRRQSENREIAAYVVGNLDNDPPLGNAAATRVAHLMAGDDEVLRIDPREAGNSDVPDDVGAVQITLPKDSVEEQWRTVMRRMLSRVPSRIDIVVLVDEDDVPWFCRELAEVRVTATEIDDVLQFHRVKFNPYSGDVYYQEMNGLHGESES